MTGDGSELWDDGDAFNLGQSRVNGDDVVAVLLEQDLGAVGVAIGLVTGAEDDDAFRCVGGHGFGREGEGKRGEDENRGSPAFLAQAAFLQFCYNILQLPDNSDAEACFPRG